MVWPQYNQSGGEQGFDDSPLTIGYIRGARAFRVTDAGILTGVTYPAVWVDGENVAVCFRSAQIVSTLAGRWIEDGPEPPPSLADRDPVTGRWVHDMKGCSCGLWSYWADLPNLYWEDSRVFGVIKGYGQTRRGTRGARVAKASILGIYLPDSDITRPGRLRDLIIANYPTVDVFGSVEALLEAHPPSRDVSYTATTTGGVEHT